MAQISSYGRLGCSLRGSAGALAILGMALALAAPASAEKVGIAAAVNPDAFSSLSGSPQSQLNIGKSIFFNERINTTTSGLVQVLLADGSTFTVGPGSDLVIDKFVYDPRKKSGEVVATFSKGVMRFVGGKISKNEGGVTVNTPSGALAIRGGMFQGKVGGGQSLFSFLYGVEMKFTGKNGQTQSVYEPGYTLDLSGGTATVRPTTAQDTNSLMAALTNSNTNSGPADTNKVDQQTQLVNDTLSLQELISEANATKVDESLEADEIDEPAPPSTDPIKETEVPPPPVYPQVTLRVLTPPHSYTAYNQTHNDPASNGILGGDDDPEVDADDFEWTFSIIDGRLVGKVEGKNDGDGIMSPALVDFPAEFAGCSAGLCPVTDAKITQDGITDIFKGHAVLRQDFYAYHVVEHTPPLDQAQNNIQDGDGPDRILAFGGKAYNFGDPSGRVFLFQLAEDPTQPNTAPFASVDSSPNGEGRGYVSPLMFRERDGGGENQSQAVWLQTSLFVGTRGDNNDAQSFIVVALGGQDAQTGGLVGARRGGSDTNDAYSFSGDIASLAGPDGSHFMGTDNPNIVIGHDSTGTRNIGRDTPLNPGENNSSVQDQTGATYHIGVGSTQTGNDPLQSLDVLKGYASGFAQKPDNSTPIALFNVTPNDISLSFNAETNTMTASFHVGDGLLQNPRYNLEFGGEGRSAYIDDNLFAAIESESGSGVSEKYLAPKNGFPFVQVKTHVDENPDVQGYMVSADAIKANEVLFPKQQNEAQKQAFCTNCNYIKWGAWGSRVTHNDHTGQAVTNDVHLGWWIAGDIATNAQLPITGSASYEGDAIGTVASKSANGTWNQYVATGDLDMSWNFASRKGQLDITNFDGRSFGGDICGKGFLCIKGDNHFVGDLKGANNIRGLAAGSFVGPVQADGHAGKPSGVIGNFGVGNDTWKANGIFGGTRVPQ